MEMEFALRLESSGGDLGWPLRRAVGLNAGVVAVVDGERRLTYAQLAVRVLALGSALDELGLAPGSRVGFLGVNSLAHLECWLGVPAFGRVLVDLNFRLAEAELGFMVDDCELEALIVDRERLNLARSLRQRCRSLRTLVLDAPGADREADCVAYELLLEREPVEQQPVADTALAAISYTGGTTGRPKGVMLSHANLLANARHNLIATSHQASDRWLHCCPMFHVAGTANVFAATWVGARHVIVPRFDAAGVAEAIDREQITHTVLVPTMIAMLLDRLDQGGGDAGGGEAGGEDGGGGPAAMPVFPSLRHLQYAASPISPDLQRRLGRWLRCDVAQFYGMTEAAPTVTCCPPDDHRRGVAGEQPYRRRLRSIGVPVVGVEAEVRGYDGRRLPAEEVGELWVRGPNVMLGYWRRDQASAAALLDGWYRTGDACYADGDGYLYLVDRLKDMIITGGENVYSIEVEAALLEHGAVREAAVFGVPDPRWGEAVHAVVAVEEGVEVDAADLVVHCRALIAGYKIPRTVEIRHETLPKSGAGKLLKHVLREPFWPDPERRIG
jgi:long-chain acyl-CoA synthetase